ncbi:IS66 family transposase, partial [Ferrimicrobium acidiphilum]
EGLCRHEEFPELPLDNNPAERVLRNPAVIRKNCYGSGSAWAATLAARIWTITATAERAGANPLAYLSAYLQECGAAGGKAPNPTALERFFPWVASEADLAMWRVSPPGPTP